MKDRHFEILGNMLGVNTYNAIKSKKAKDKVLPSEYYRNRFITNNQTLDWEDMKEMQKLKWVDVNLKYKTLGNNVLFFVTEKGIEQFEKEFNERVDKI